MKNNLYNVKSAFELKDMDSEKKEVAIYLSKFDSIDSDNDLIRRGSFTKSIQERGVNASSNRKIAFLRHHNWEMQIGKFLRLEEDSNGLFAVGKLGNSTMGNDAWEDYKMGIIREHSIGFKYVKDKMKWIEDKSLESEGYFEIAELMLFEGSAVTFGANEYTPVVGVMKSAEERADAVKKLNDDINIIIKALTSGNFSDERGYQLEMKLKYLNNQLVLLASQEPMTKSDFIDASHSQVIEPVAAYDWNKIMDGVAKTINH
jgi:uncharacterized protein